LCAALAAPLPVSAAPPAKGPQYHFVSLTDALPPGYLFVEVAAILDDRRIYGTAYRCDDIA